MDAMEQTTSTEVASVRGTAWDTAAQAGLSAGLVLAGLNVANWLAGLYADGEFASGQAGVTFTQPICGIGFVAACALFLGRLVLFYRAGYRVAKRTERIRLGALAGLVAGVVDGVSGLVVMLLGVALFPMYTLSDGFAGTVQPVGGALLQGLMKVLVLAVAGGLLGGIGGVFIEGERYAGAV